MKIIIKDPIKKKVITDTYKVSTNCMHGDGDGNTEQFLYIKPDKEAELVLVVQYLKYAQKNDKEDKAPKKFRGIEEKLHKLHPGDFTCDWQHRAYLQSWKVSYFDAEGIEHSVSVMDEIKDIQLEPDIYDFLLKMDWYRNNLTVQASIKACKEEIKTKAMNVKKRQRLIDIMLLNTEPINVVEFFDQIGLL